MAVNTFRIVHKGKVLAEENLEIVKYETDSYYWTVYTVDLLNKNPKSSYSDINKKLIISNDKSGDTIKFASNSSQKFKDDYNKAVTHLKDHNVGDIITKLEKSSTTIMIKELKTMYNEGASFDFYNNTIIWNPRQGVWTENNIIVSPTLILNHEADHALIFVEDPEEFYCLLKEEDSQYKTSEEKRVITGSEQRTASALGEIEADNKTRYDHKGKLIEVESPTSNYLKMPKFDDE